MTNSVISKTNFISYKQCEKLLWLEKFKPHELASGDTKQTADGEAVGSIARMYFPTAVTVSLDTAERMARKTKELIGAGETTICEATFLTDGLSCSVDILRVLPSDEKTPRTVEIIEVKSTVGVKDHQVTDVAFQSYVLKKAGYHIARVALMHLNSEYVRHGDIDVHQLFAMEDVTMRALSYDYIERDVERAREILRCAHEPSHELSIGCEKPFECPAKAYCHRCHSIPEASVFSISGMSAAKKYELYAKGIITPDDLSSHREHLTDKQYACVGDMRAEDVNTPDVNTAAVRRFLAGLQYPLYLLDFETVQNAVPQYDGTTPYQQVPFQYSLHIMESIDGPIIHKEYLADPREDPRDKLVEQLCHDIPENVMSMAYNNSFEKRVCRALAKRYPKSSEHLLNIAENMTDLMVPFRNRWVSTPSMHGSYSIKAVLPALCGNDPSIDYHRLPVVHNGAEAMSIFADMTSGRIDPSEFDVIRKGLLLYCGLDTLAMVKVLQKLYELTA